jgi:alginate O-acetyltransferase complex protein AlgI
VVFALVTLGWVFFRAPSLGDAWYVLTHLGAGLGGQLAALAAREPAALRDVLFLGFASSKLVLATAAVSALLAVERLQAGGPIRVRLSMAAAPLRWAAYACAVLTIMTLGVFQSARFIYFQF